MNLDFTERATKAVDRYANFLNVLRSQADLVFRRGPTDETLRRDALSTAQGAARAYIDAEHAQINEDSADVARAAYNQVRDDMRLPEDGFAALDRLGDFIFSAAYYTSRLLAAQAERDVMSMAQHIQSTAMRVDLYARSGRHTLSSAAAAVMLEDREAPAFRYIDRLGRRYKATKHIRDAYRLHLLNLYNEVYMDVAAEHGHDILRVDHPEPTYKWAGQPLLIVTGAPNTDGFPLYYDVRDEIFHPSSAATLTLQSPGD